MTCFFCGLNLTPLLTWSNGVLRGPSYVSLTACWYPTWLNNLKWQLTCISFTTPYPSFVPKSSPHSNFSDPTPRTLTPINPNRASGAKRSGMSRSSSLQPSDISTNSSPTIPGRRCFHGRRATLYTSWSKSNPSRRFFRCGLWRDDDCGFFEWYDEDCPSRQKEAILQLVEAKKKLENTIEVMKKEEAAVRLEMKKMEEEVANFRRKRCILDEAKLLRFMIFSLVAMIMYLVVFGM